jgi:predicted DNA-binding protein (UPF0251 family)
MSKEKTRQEMAEEYGVCRKTFYTMLKKAGIKLTSGLLTPKEQKEIYRKLGDPNPHNNSK